MYQCCIYMVLPKSSVVRNRIRGRYTKMHHSPYSRYFQNEAATALFANKSCRNKLDPVSCTYYFVSMHSVRWRVQLIKIGKNILKQTHIVSNILALKTMGFRHLVSARCRSRRWDRTYYRSSMYNGSENVDSYANHVLRKKVSSYMISYMDDPLHKYMSISQRYWYFFKS